MDYKSYCYARRGDIKAIEVYSALKKVEGDSVLRELLVDMIRIAVGFGVMASILRGVYAYKLEAAKLWISSPSGKTVKELPFKIAMRVIRKHKWGFTEVEPIKSPRVISRREAIKIFIFGDNHANNSVPNNPK